MAELIVKIGSVSADPRTYQDGDPIDVFSDKRIACQAVQALCHLRRNGRSTEGLNLLLGLNGRFNEIMSTKRFVRLNETQVRIDDLVAKTSRVSSVIQTSTDFFPVKDYVRNASMHKTPFLFGSLGEEIWYSSYLRTFTPQLLLRVWNMIESNSRHRQMHYTRMFLSDEVLSRCLCISIEDPSDPESSRIVESRISEDGKDTVLEKRKRKMPWDTLDIGASVLDIRDRNKKLDLRTHRVHPKTSIKIKT